MPRLATGMLVRVVDTSDVGTLIQIRESSQTCVIKLTNGTLKKNVPLDDVKEVRDGDGGGSGATHNSAKSPIRLAANEPLLALPSSSLSASAASPTKRNHTAPRIEVGDAVRARYKKGAKWFTGKILKVRMDGTYDVQYEDGDVEMKVAGQYVEAAVVKQDHEKSPKLRLSLSPVKSPMGKGTSSSSGVRFAVGDKIKARYKKSNKLFAGKITRAHADGTFDIRYDDGDVETRVEARYIQSERSDKVDNDDDSETPRVESPSTKSSTTAKKTRMDDLEVGDAVKARYKKSNKLFAGKITRAHADGTFDIRYEDGDLETRVATQYIEPQRTTTRNDTSSSSPKKSVAKESQLLKQRRIGDKVKARYKKGAKFFNGTVTKVHADGSVDIHYEDGDTESRVDARYIESMDGSDTDVEPQTMKKWRVDDPVMAKYRKGKKLYAGVVKRVHSDGSYDIKYEDGDVETRVEPQYMELVAARPTKESPSKKKNATVSSFDVGDKVKARYKGSAKVFAGTILKIRTDGTYDIRYDDGDVETHVEPRHIEAIDDPNPNKTHGDLLLETGDRVLARYKKGAKSFPGRVTKTHADGTFDIHYDDGAAETRVKIQYIERHETPTKSEPELTLLRVGDHVKARYKKSTKYFSGKITRVRSNGTFDIQYDDGDVELQVVAAFIEPLDRETPKSPIKKTKSLEVGDYVKARYKKGAKLFRGVVKRVRSDGSYDIKYEDGDMETRVEPQYIEQEEDKRSDSETKTKTEPAHEVGDAVKARYKNSQKWFAGRISRVRADATYDIEYDDGELAVRVTADKIQAEVGVAKTKSKSKSKEIRVGDAVKARYRGGKKLYAAEITRVRTDGTFDVQFEDGGVEIRLDRELIECPGDDEETITKLRALVVGDVVLAQYKGGKNMYKGRISRVRANGSYDVEYDDGDTEQSVAAEKIQRVESPKTKTKTGEEEDEDGDREEMLAVGGAVQAYYKRGKKLFAGKIVRCHSDGVFDIHYDDGDVEKRVERKWIVVGDTKKLKTKTTKAKRLSVGDAVKATHRRSGARRVRGRISRERSDGTFDIEFTDGETATRVERELIEVEQGKEEAEKEEPRGRKVTAFKVGDAVSARYEDGLEWYDGKVKRVRSDGAVDIQFEDGDLEERVASKNVRHCENDTRTSPKKTTVKMSRNTRKVLTKGDVVEVDSKQCGRYKRAIVVRVYRGGDEDDDEDGEDNGGFLDVQYEASGELERRVARRLVRVVDVRDDEEEDKREKKNKTNKNKHASSDSEQSGGKMRRRRRAQPTALASSASSSSSDSSSHIKTKTKTKQNMVKGCRVTMRKAVDAKSRRVGRVRKVYSDGSCDVVYADGDKAKRLSQDALLVCSDSEDDDDDDVVSKSKSNRRGGLYMRNQSVLACWRRATRMAKPSLSDRWEDAVVLARSDDDGTYSIRYRSGEMEENVPEEAMKHRDDESPKASKRPAVQLNQERDLSDSDVVFLLEQLAMTLYEEGEQKKKPQLRFADYARSDSGSSSNDNSSSSSSNSSGSDNGSSSEESKTSSSKEKKKQKSKNKNHTNSSTTKKNEKKMKGSVEKAIHRLFDSKLLKKYKALFDQHDTDRVGRINKSKIIRIVEQLCSTTTSGATSDTGHVRRHLCDWFTTQDSLRTHSKFDFTTLLVAFAVVKHHFSTLLIQQNMANALNARFASHHESQRQLELWQQKLGFRTFELLQRSFTDSAVPRMFPAQVRVRELAAIFDLVTRSAVPSKPLEVFLSQMKLLPHHTLHLPAFLCCFYQLYGSAPAFHHHYDSLPAGIDTLELRPVAFVASCLFSNGDACCARHGDLVRRLSIGRTPAQEELVMRFREVFESLQDSTADGSDTISSSQLDAFAAGVVRDPCVLSPFLQALRKRTAAVSLVELFATCGFVIDELTAAPTVTNAIDKMRLRADATQVRRIVTLVRSMCLKVLRFPNNPDYWRIRCDSPAFHAKLGRVHGATSLLEAVGFVEYGKTHLELRGARSLDGRRQAVSSLPKTTLDTLRDACGELDAELSVMDGVESVVSILQRIAAERRHETPLSLEECGDILRNLVAYVENVLKNPKDSRCWRIRETNKTFQRQIGYLPFHADLMASIGYDVAASGSSQGSVFVLRGTGLSGTSSATQPTATAAGASLANFAFSSVSSQMEWFLWRRKQEMESLLQDDMEYLVQMLAPSTASSSDHQIQSQKSSLQTRLVSSSLSSGKMYPYGRNALEIFSRNAAQKTQLAMIKRQFELLDTKQSGFLGPEELLAQQLTSFSRRWAAFECFDLDGDGCVDFADFVGALGPALDHAFDPLDVAACVPFHKMTLSEQLSTLVGRVRLTVTVAESTAVLDAVINCVGRIVDQPDVVELREIPTKSALAGFAARLPVVKELLQLAGYRSPPPPPPASPASTVNVKGPIPETVAFVLQPQSQNQVRFQTNQTKPPASAVLKSVKPLDPQTRSRLQLLVAMLSGHTRLLVFPAISDVGAVARAIGEMRPITAWLKLTELAVLCLDNVLTHADDELRYRQLKTTTQTFTSVVSTVAGGVALFVAIGFRETDRGTLLLTEEITRAQIQARKLELEVGGDVLRIVDKLNKQETEEEVFPRTLSPGKGEGGNAAVDYYKRKALAAELAREEAMRKSAHLEKQLEIVAKSKPTTTGLRRGGATASAPSTPTSRSRAELHKQKQQRQSKATIAADRVGPPRARAAPNTSQFYSIETEILKQFSPRKRDADHQPEQEQAQMRSSQSTRGAIHSSSRQPPPKSTQRRTPSSARAPANAKTAATYSTTVGALHESSMAMDSHAGNCSIVVRNSSTLSLQPGALVRVGVENRDLTEERLIVHVDHTTYPSMAKLILHAPLQFPHYAKDLVFVLPSKVADTSGSSSASRLILADLEMFLRETVLDEIMEHVVGQHSTSSAGIQPSVSALNKTSMSQEIQSGDLFVVGEIQLPRYVSVSTGGFRGEQLVVVCPSATTPRKSDTSTIVVYRDIVTLHKLRAVYEGLLLQCGDTKKRWSSICAAAVRKVPWLAMHQPNIGDLNKTRQEPPTWSAFAQWLQFPLGDEKPTKGDQDGPEDEPPEQLLALTLLKPHFRALMSSSRLDDNGIFSIVETKELVKRASSSLLALTSSPPVDTRDLTVVQTLFSELLKLYDRGNGVSWPETVYCIRHAHTLLTPEMFPVAPHALILSSGTEPTRAVAAIVCARSSLLMFVLFMDGYLEAWRFTGAASECVTRILALFPTSSSSSSSAASTAHTQSTSYHAHESFVEDYFSVQAHATRDHDWFEHQRQRVHACLDDFLRPSTNSKINSNSSPANSFSSRSLLALTAHESCVVVNASMLVDGGLTMFQLDNLSSLRPLQRLRLESSSRTIKSKNIERVVKSSGVIETFAFSASGKRVAFTTVGTCCGGVLWIADGATGGMVACVDEFAWIHDRCSGMGFGWSDADDPLLYVTATKASYVSVWQLHHQDDDGESRAKNKKSKSLRRIATCVLTDQGDDSSTTTIASSLRPSPFITSLAISAETLVAATSDGALVVWTVNSSILGHNQPPVRIHPAAHIQQKRASTITDVVVLTADYDGAYRLPESASDGCWIPEQEEQELQAWDSHLPDRCVRLALYLLADGELVSVPVATGGARGFSLSLVTLNEVWNVADDEELRSHELERVLVQPERVLRVVLLACEYLRDGVFAQKSVNELLMDLQTSKVLYGTHTQIQTFVAGYRDSVRMEMRCYYRENDSADCALSLSPLCSGSSHLPAAIPRPQSLLVGVVAAPTTGSKQQTEGNSTLQLWSFSPAQFSTAKAHSDAVTRTPQLAQRAVWQLEAFRIRRQRALVSSSTQRDRFQVHRTHILTNIKRLLLTTLIHDHRERETRDRVEDAVLAKVEQLCRLTALEMRSSESGDPVERFICRVVSHVSAADPAADVVETFREAERDCALVFCPWLRRLRTEMLSEPSQVTLDAVIRLIRRWRRKFLSFASLCDVVSELGLLVDQSSLLQQFCTFALSRRTATIATASHSVHASADSEYHHDVLTFIHPRLAVDFLLKTCDVGDRLEKCIDVLADRTLEKRPPHHLKDHRSSVTAELLYARLLQRRRLTERLCAIEQRQLTCQYNNCGDPKSLFSNHVSNAALQSLKRILKTSLPNVAPDVVSVTICVPVELRRLGNHVVVVGGVDADSRWSPARVPFSIVLFPGRDVRLVQQECAFYRRVQPLKTRELFLPVVPTANDLPLLKSEHLMPLIDQETMAMHVICETLADWRALRQSLQYLQKLHFNHHDQLSYWQQVIAFCSRQVLLALVVLEEQGQLTVESLDLDDVLVSPDGSQLRVATLKLTPQSHATATDHVAVFGAFVVQLCEAFSAPEHHQQDHKPTNDFGERQAMQQRVWDLWLLAEGDDDDNQASQPLLSPPPSLSAVGFEEFTQRHARSGNASLARVVAATLLALQPPGLHTRPDSASSLWALAFHEVAEDAPMPLVAEFGWRVDLQSQLEQLVLVPLSCLDDSGGIAQRSSVDALTAVTLFKTTASHIDTLLRRLLTLTTTEDWQREIQCDCLHRISTHGVLLRLASVVIGIFENCLRAGQRDAAHGVIQSTLQLLQSLLVQVETSATLALLLREPHLQQLLGDVVHALCIMCGAPLGAATPSPAVVAALWRLSESTLMDLIGSEAHESTVYPTTLHFLQATKASLAEILPVEIDSKPSTTTSGPLLAVWWHQGGRYTRSHQLLPQRAPRAVVATSPFVSLAYLKAVHQTLELRFNASSATTTASSTTAMTTKFRLAALQSFASPEVLDRHSHPRVAVAQELTARVWLDLEMATTLHDLLRDSDDRVVFSALSILGAYTRVLRCHSDEVFGHRPKVSALALAYQLGSQYHIQTEVACVVTRLVRVLKIQGEAGTNATLSSRHQLNNYPNTSGTSRVQVTPVALLSVAMAFLVNCAHGGDACTQHWVSSGLSTALLAHAKARSLAFVTLLETKWMSSSTTCLSSSASSQLRSMEKSSPFELLVRGIATETATRNVLLVQHWWSSSSYFRQLVDLLGDNTTAQLVATASREFGKLAHLWDTLQDVDECDGTLEERQHALEYAAAVVRVWLVRTEDLCSTGVPSAVLKCCRVAWSWMETSWRVLSRNPHTPNTENEMMSDHAAIVTGGVQLLETIAQSDAISSTDLERLMSAVDDQDDHDDDDTSTECVVARLVQWLQRTVGTTPSASDPSIASVVYAMTELLLTLVDPPATSVAAEQRARVSLQQWVGLQHILRLLQTDVVALSRACGSLAYAVHCKRRLWAALLAQCGDRDVTRGVVLGGLMDYWLGELFDQDVQLQPPQQAEEGIDHDEEDGVPAVNARLEVVGYLELLVHHAQTSGLAQVQQLTTDMLKSVLHHRTIQNEKQRALTYTQFSRTSRAHYHSQSTLAHRMVATAKRVVQLVCCLATELLATSGLDTAVTQVLRGAGVSRFVLDWHQQSEPCAQETQEAMRVREFWDSWPEESVSVHGHRPQRRRVVATATPSVAATNSQLRRQNGGTMSSAVGSTVQAQVQWSAANQQLTQTTVAPHLQQLQQPLPQPQPQRQPPHGDTVLPSRVPLDELLACLADEIAPLECVFQRHAVRCGPHSRTEKLLAASRLAAACRDCNIPPQQTRNHNHDHDDGADDTTKDTLTFSQFLQEYAHRSGLQDLIQQQVHTAAPVSFVWLASGQWVSVVTSKMAALESAFHSRATSGRTLSIDHAVELLLTLHHGVFARHELRKLVVEELRSTPTTQHTPVELAAVALRDLRRAFAVVSREAAAKPALLKLLLPPPPSATTTTERGAIPISPVRVTAAATGSAATSSPTRGGAPLSAAAAEQSLRGSVVQTLMSIDMDSARALQNQKQGQTRAQTKNRLEENRIAEPKQKRGEDGGGGGGDDESIGSDAYSPFSGHNSSGDSSEVEGLPRKKKTKKIKRRTKAQRRAQDTKEEEEEEEQEMKLRRSDSEKSSSSSSRRSSSDSASSGLRGKSKTPNKKMPKKKKKKKMMMMRPQGPKRQQQQHTTLRGRQEAALREIFAKYDVDGDGAIGFVDLRRVLGPSQLSNVELQRWIAEKDRRGVGAVDFDDFAFAFAATTVANGPSTASMTPRQLLP